MALLNEMQVRIIRRFPQPNGTYGMLTFLASMFGVTFHAIYRVRYNKNWRRVRLTEKHLLTPTKTDT